MSYFETLPQAEWGLEYSGLGNMRPTLAACGYDRRCYISTAQLVSAPYTSQLLVQAKLGGLAKLIEACDDSVPPAQQWNATVQAVFSNILQNVTTEINGYLTSIYPIPLMQTGTVAILKVTGISTDGNGAVTAIEMLSNGNYLTAPAVANSPAYLNYNDDGVNCECFGEDWQWQQKGIGLALDVAYQQANFSDESGQTIQINQVDGTPTITDGGSNYRCGQILVLTGGSSIVPAKIREAALSLTCHDLYQRRLAPEEKNLFSIQNLKWRGTEDTKGFLTKIGEGDMQLDGTFRRLFSPGACWGQTSVMFPANSL